MTFTPDDLVPFIDECREVRRLIESGLNHSEVANKIGCPVSSVGRLVAVGYFPERLINTKILAMPNWTKSRILRLVGLRRTKEGLPIKYISNNKRDLLALDYTEVERAIDLINEGQLVSKSDIATYVASAQTRFRKENPLRSEQRHKKEAALRREIENEVREKMKEEQAKRITHMILSARTKASAAYELRAAIVWSLLSYASVDDLLKLLQDVNYEIDILKSIKDVLTETMAPENIVFLNGSG